MKTKTDRKDLIVALEALKPLAATKNQSHLMHDALMLSAQDATLRLRTIHYVAGYIAEFTIGAEVEVQGQNDNYYSLKDLLAILKKYISDFVTLEFVPEEVKATKNRGAYTQVVLVVRSGRSQSKLRPNGEFETDWDFGERDRFAEPHDWGKYFRSVLYAAATDESRPILTNVYLKNTKSGSDVVAADGYRLAIAHTDVDLPGDGQFIVPRSIAKHIAGFKVLATMSFQEKHVLIETEHLRIRSVLFSGTYPDYVTIASVTEKSDPIFFSKEDMLQAINIASVFGRDQANKIDVSIGSNGLVVAGRSHERGESAHTIACQPENGFTGDFSANYQYLQNAVSFYPDPTVKMVLNRHYSENHWYQVRLEAENQLHVLMAMT